MQYPYLVAHSDAALPPIELAMDRLSREDLIREYEHVDFPFRFFFDGRMGVKARYEQLPDARGLKITIETDVQQQDADAVLADFLSRWNHMIKGLAVILEAKLQPIPSPY